MASLEDILKELEIQGYECNKKEKAWDILSKGIDGKYKYIARIVKDNDRIVVSLEDLKNRYILEKIRNKGLNIIIEWKWCVI